MDNLNWRHCKWIIVTALLISWQPTFASGDFPLASCKGWGGTVVARKGINTTKASMRGTITHADFQEYCERTFGNETASSAKIRRFAQCVAQSQREFPHVVIVSEANCRTGLLTLHSSSAPTAEVKFPLQSDTDTSCASGMPPLIEQFKLLCPASAAKMHVE